MKFWDPLSRLPIRQPLNAGQVSTTSQAVGIVSRIGVYTMPKP